MIKKLLSIFLALCMIITMMPVTGFAALGDNKDAVASSNTTPFTDVKKTDWFYDAVQYAYGNGIFSGTSATTFEPNGTMTRGMFVTVLGRMAGVDTASYKGKSAFSDVPTDAYYTPFVAWAAKHGITSGVGKGKFAPNERINRQQMAVFFARYFETFAVNYDTGVKVTTTPADIDNVADFAREAVLKLWKVGLLAGDGVNFNPLGNATRAEAAMLCMRTDNSVKTWYKEPGVASGRVSVDPGTSEKPIEQPDPPSGGSTTPGDSTTPGGSTTPGDSTTPGGSTTTYYKVEFKLGDGSDPEVTLPETKTYASGTAITTLPTPFKQNTVFLGWYYDNAMTQGVESDDTVTSNMTLYARMADSTTMLSEGGAPDYVSSTDIDVSKGFAIQLTTNADIEDIKVINISNGNEDVTSTVTISNGVVSGAWKAGQTYQLEVLDSGVSLYFNGALQNSAIRYYNFTTAKDPVLNLKLNKGLTYISAKNVQMLTNTSSGLYSGSVQNGRSSLTENTDTGSFTYTEADLLEGDTVAIYSGDTAPNTLTTAAADSGDVSYVTITKVEGTKYDFKVAEADDVLFTPDVLPVSTTADKIANDGNKLTVDAEALDFTDDQYVGLGLDSQTTVDEGDFIGFYTGTYGDESNASKSVTSYAKIIDVIWSSDKSTCTIDYVPVDQSTILAAMDAYGSRNQEIELTDSDKKRIENEIEKEAKESGFAQEASVYLASLALETDGFRTLRDDMNLQSYSFTMEDGAALIRSNVALRDANKVSIEDLKVNANISRNLSHFEDSTGLRAALNLSFKVIVNPESDKQIEITVQAIFEQEVLLDLNVSGEAIWKWAWIFPYIYDYRLNANIDVGTYTGVGITATALSKSAGDEWEWDESDDFDNIGQQIKELMEEKEKFLGEEVDTVGGGLAAKYARMLENESDWVELFNVNLFKQESRLLLGVLVFGVSVDFVVSANMNITVGMSFEYANAKRYNFSLLLFHKQSTSDTIDLEPEHYQFDFYVMGTLGVRAGIRLTVYVGLFDKDFACIGITAEAGAYVQLWGYFYYSLHWDAATNMKESSYSGAMLVEIGIYLDIKFLASAFGGTFASNPTIYEKTWPLWGAGKKENVLDFAYEQKDAPEVEWLSVKNLVLPDDLFKMTYIDLTSGKTVEKAYADDDFTISFSNPAFSYNKSTNTLTVSPFDGSMEEFGEMTLIWNGAPLTFTSKPISRVIPVSWSSPTGGYYIEFNSDGGSMVKMIYKAAGGSIPRPADPVKQGYDFGGWYTDSSYTTAYSFEAVMPESNTSIVAKWNPRNDIKYKVEHYLQNLGDNNYTLMETDEKNDGTTDAQTAVIAKSYEGYTPKSVEQQKVLPDGSTVVKVYYDRNFYTVSFTYGEHTGSDPATEDYNAPITYKKKFGSTIYAPTLALGGYFFDGFRDVGESITLTENVTYGAIWTPDPNTPYRVEHYIQRTSGDGYVLPGHNAIQSATGTTGEIIDFSAIKLTDSGLNYLYAKVNGEQTTEPKISADGKTVVKLYYDRNSYTLTYKNGTETIGTPQSLRFGVVLQAPDMPEKEGYQFTGWYTDAACTPGNEFSFENSPTMPAANLTLYANMEAKARSYTVNHFVMGTDGQYPSSPTTTDANQPTQTDATLTLANLVKDNLLAPNGIVYVEGKVGSGSAVTSYQIPASGDVVINLYYERKQHTLRWNFNEGTPSGGYTVEGSVYYGADIIVPTLTKQGYQYTWNEVPTTMPAQDVTYTANWTESDGIDYKVEYYLQNADNNEYTLDETVELSGRTNDSVSAPEKQYINFTENTSHENRLISGNIAADGSLVLKRYYDRDQITVTFSVGEGGTLGSDGASKTFRYGQIFAVTEPTRDDYAFAGWYNGATKFESTTVIEAMSLTAHWTAGAVNYTVEHYIMDTNGNYPTNANYSASNSGVVNDTVTLSTLKNRDYEVPDGIAYKEAKVGSGPVVETATIAKNMIVKLYYERSKYTLDWNLAGGTADNTYTQGGEIYYDAVITSPQLTKTGWTYTWDVTPAAKMPAQHVSYTANWTANNYTVSFNSNGGSGSMSNQSFTYDEANKALSRNVYTREGYSFLGWAETLNGTRKYQDQELVQNLSSTKDGTVTLYAVWSANSYTISYVLNSGINHANNPSTYTVESTVTLSNPTRIGYTFKGWYAEADFSGDSVTGIAKGSTGAKTFYAKWEELTYTISYALTGGTVDGTNPTSYTVNSVAITLINPTKAGYNFDGWTGTGLTSKTVTVTIVTGSTDNRTYNANWTAIEYAINYDLGTEDATNTGNPATYTIEDEITLARPERVGYTFEGWYSNDQYTGDAVTGITKGSTGEIHLYAKWVQNTKTINYEKPELFDESSALPSAYTPGIELILPKVKLKDGSIFLYWYTDSNDPETSKITKIPENSTADYVLYAMTQTTSEADPYIISNLEGLKEFRDNVNSGFWDYESQYFKLGADITLFAAEWAAIGTEEHPFKGVFDGDKENYSIIHETSTSVRTRQALFGTNNGTVKNLRVYVGDLYSTNSDIAAIALLNNNIIQNCTVTSSGTINNGIHCDNIKFNIGGIAAVNSVNGKIIDCTVDNANNGWFKLTNGTTYTGYTIGSIGGIVGKNEGEITYTGSATLNVLINSNYNNVGGIAGISSGTIDGGNSSNMLVKVELKMLDTSIYIGGVVGNQTGGTIKNITASGSVIGSYVGGIVGSMDKGTITQCKVTNMTLKDNQSREAAGGIAGGASEGVMINNCELSIVTITRTDIQNYQSCVSLGGHYTSVTKPYNITIGSQVTINGVTYTSDDYLQ